jgi:hypothetical protein
MFSQVVKNMLCRQALATNALSSSLDQRLFACIDGCIRCVFLPSPGSYPYTTEWTIENAVSGSVVRNASWIAWEIYIS